MLHFPRFYGLKRVLFFFLIALLPVLANAAPVTETQAEQVVQGWLAANSDPFGTSLSTTIDATEAFYSQALPGRIAYFVVSLDPTGYVVVSGDDLVEPVVAFVVEGNYDLSEDNPLAALVSTDMDGRVQSAEAYESGTSKNLLPDDAANFSSAKSKWEQLLSDEGDKAGLASVSDLRVGPLVATLWAQSAIGLPDFSYVACYNYYTPPYGDGNTYNHPCGCVATAMAQIMRYFQYPTGNIGTASYTITVDGTPRLEALRGGNGSGGPYNWGAMPTRPWLGATLAERQAIGALTHD